MYAVIKAGGRQYKVAPGDVIDVNRLTGEPGDRVTFPVALVVDGDAVKATASDLGGTVVAAEVVSHGRGKKIRVRNYHSKTGWKRTKGHRQDLTTVKITEIT